MYGVREACAELVDRLKAADFASVSVDPAELSPQPVALWISPRQISGYTLGGGAQLLAYVYIVCGNVEIDDAFRLLDDALEGVLAVIDPADSDDVIDLTTPVILPGNPGTPLPAFRVAVDLDL
jgi:hypothetical protein